MRTDASLVAVAAVVGLTLGATAPAKAFDAYRWICGGPTSAADCDPYAYQYEPRRYYPYRNSGHWKPAWAYRRPYGQDVLPPYYQAWGSPDYAEPRHDWWDRLFGER